jgi:hypothetical protein
MEYMRSLFILAFMGCSAVVGQDSETLHSLGRGQPPQNFAEMWSGFDPRAEPLEVETIREWEEDDTVLRIVRFRIGVFKGKKATLAAVYGFPKSVAGGSKKLPGLVQIHGGGQYADYQACLLNAQRGYATVSIAWAGRISAPGYRVDPSGVKLFWDGKTDDPNYKLTTDWGAVDGYHAPGRNPGNVFPSAKSAAWTLDAVESPRNSGWFLCAIAARRALTFLEQQPEVDRQKLGVYGHSMGGKLTVLAAVDSRVKAAAPSCGGISDRDNNSPLFRSTLGDDVSLKKISCPIIFLSPANDFHGRIGDLPRAIGEIQSEQWRVTCSPHGSHQDSAEYEVATLLWFDEHLKGSFAFPKTPITTLELENEDGIPTISIRPDRSRKILSVDVFYTQHGKNVELPSDRENTKSRFWRHADATTSGKELTAQLPLTTIDKPLWVYANVTYALNPPVSGAGYYYGKYTATTFNLSSTLHKASPEQLKTAGVKAELSRSSMIETFADGWQKEWFTYKPEEWPRATHKVYDEQYHAPDNAKLQFQVRSVQPNTLVVMIDGYVAVIAIEKAEQWQDVVLTTSEFRNHAGDVLPSWAGIQELKLSDAERLRPARGSSTKSRIVGKDWQGPRPVFRNLRWVTDAP